MTSLDGGHQYRPPDVSRGEKRDSADVTFLERRVERLSLICQAMWTLLRETSGLDEGQLLDRMNELDMRDGRADGKLKKMASSCPQCGRGISTRHAKCMFCGSGKPVDSAFDLV